MLFATDSTALTPDKIIINLGDLLLHKRSVLSSLLLPLALMTPALLMAQVQLEEVVVTAQKRQQSLQDRIMLVLPAAGLDHPSISELCH